MLTDHDLDVIWNLFLNKAHNKLSKNLVPTINLLGSQKMYKKHFINAYKEIVPYGKH